MERERGRGESEGERDGEKREEREIEIGERSSLVPRLLTFLVLEAWERG